MIKKGKIKVCKRCEYNKECDCVNKPMRFCIQIDRNPRKILFFEKNKVYKRAQNENRIFCIKK